MVVEIQCCVNSTNQCVQRPSASPENYRPLKKYYRQCCQFGDFVAKFSYFLIVAVTFIDFFCDKELF